ncbi:TrkA C-terminal domain-containing protein, partial [Deinococcus sp. MIMF12]
TIRRAPAATAPLLPLHAAPPEETGTGLAPLESEQELYRRAVPRSWAGARLSVLSLPPGVEVVGVVRGGTVRVPRPQMRLTAEDELVFLARPDAYAALEGVLRLPGV